MIRTRIQALLAILPGAVILQTQPARAEARDMAPMAAYLENHCLKCHGQEKQKGDLRLDTLSLPPQETDRWQEVLEAIEYGDMPPKKEKRPEQARTDDFTDSLRSMLAAHAGPSAPALRRMNRNEFQNTVRELFGVDTEVADMLPEDGRTLGFDKVGDGLSISAIMLEKYLEAANAAFDDVIRRTAPIPVETRRSVLIEEKRNKAALKKKQGGVFEEGGAFVDFTPGWPAAMFDSAQPQDDGLYRAKIAVWPHDPGGRTLTVAVFSGPLYSPVVSKFMGVFDVTGTPEKPRIIEFDVRMKAGDSLQVLPWVSPEHVTYRDKHEKRPGVGIAWGEVTGPLDQTFPSEAQRRLFGESETISMAEEGRVFSRYRKNVVTHRVESSAPREDAERIIREFVPRAMRRPVSEELTGRFVEFTLGRLDAGREFEEAVRAGVCAVLCSPQFLLLNSAPDVDDYTIASRMSYFLWSGPPDKELLELAAAGKLKDPGTRRKQVGRMLTDDKAERFVVDFTGQWLDMYGIDFTTPDKKLFPEYDSLLDKSLVRETQGFFREMLARNLGTRNFINSDFAVLNERLAAHYGIPGVKGHEEMRVVKLPPGSVRGGVLTQASIMKVTANGTNSSPVLRGVWMLDRLLGHPVPPPPPGIPAVEPDIRGAKSPKELFSKHTENETCARCHTRIDPVGFALEEFDPVGGRRERYRDVPDPDDPKKRRKIPGLPVDSSGRTPDGKSFANFEGFRDWLLDHESLVANAVAKKLMIYGCGRRIDVLDEAAVEAVVKASAKDDRGLRTMIEEVVASETFTKQ